jgi:hypothetical protein
MDDATRQRPEISKEFAAWTADLPRLVRRIDSELELPDISDPRLSKSNRSLSGSNFSSEAARQLSILAKLMSD